MGFVWYYLVDELFIQSEATTRTNNLNHTAKLSMFFSPIHPLMKHLMRRRGTSTISCSMNKIVSYRNNTIYQDDLWIIERDSIDGGGLINEVRQFQQTSQEQFSHPFILSLAFERKVSLMCQLMNYIILNIEISFRI